MAEREEILEKLWELPRDEAHKELYRRVKGTELDLNNPRDYDEKLQWLMVYHYDRNVSRFADKYLVRDYVKECGYADILTKLYGIYESVEDIDIDKLPDSFVLKATHGSGPTCYSIYRDKSKYDFNEEKLKLTQALKINYARVALEYHYSYIKPRIICEELIQDGTGSLPTDYKIYCFNGEAKYIKIGVERDTSLQMAYYDRSWVKQDFVKAEYDTTSVIEKPQNMEQMLEIAEALSKPFPTARIDFYNVSGRIYFGEITLTPACGLSKRDKKTTLEYFGSLVDLDKWQPDMIPENDRNQIMLKACRLLGGNYSDTDKEQAMATLYDYAFEDDMSLEECWQIYRNLDRAMFVNNKLKLYKGSLQQLYRYIFDFIKSQMDYTGKAHRRISERNNNLVVFTTSQFLSTGHAPTLRVLDYAYIWQAKLNKKVIIINDAMMHYYTNPQLEGVVTFNFNTLLNEKNTIEHKGEVFDFYQVSTLMPNLQVLQVLIDNIYELNPLLVFNVGGSDIFADLCTDFVSTLSQPCAFEIPACMTEYMLLGREYEARDGIRLKETEPWQKLIETNFNYIFKQTDSNYTRKQFDIPEEAFVVSVVGNRIEEEMDDRFLKMIVEVLAENTDICFVFIGPMQSEATIRRRITELYNQITDKNGVWNDKSLCFTGAVKNASELIRLTNLNINPERSGGGRAAFEALYYGIPTVSLRRGDAYYAAGSLFGVENYTEYVKAIGRYAADKEFYAKRSVMAKERAGILSNMEETHRRILEHVLSMEGD